MLGLPVVSAASSDLAPADSRQLPALGLHHLVLGDVLDGLQEKNVKIGTTMLAETYNKHNKLLY